MHSRPSTAALPPEIDGENPESETTEDPVLRSVLAAPVRPGQPPAWEPEALEQAASGPWFDGASVSAEIAARARRGR